MLVLPFRTNYRNLCSYSLPHAPREGLIVNEWDYSSEYPRNTVHRDSIAESVVRSLASGEPVRINSFSKLELCLVTTSSKRGWIARIGQESVLGAGKENDILVFFPKIEDVKAYVLASSFSLPGGPSNVFPGSVGKLQSLIDYPNKVARLIELQSCVNHTDRNAIQALSSGGRNLKSAYAHWQFDLLNLAFDHYRRSGIEVVRVETLSPEASHQSAYLISDKFLTDAVKGLHRLPEELKEQDGRVLIQYGIQ